MSVNLSHFLSVPLSIFFIIPNNHEKYIFPLNLEDRIEQTKELINNSLPNNVSFKLQDKKNGIFNDNRDPSLSSYKLSFPYENYHNEFISKLEEIGLKLDDKEWYIIIE